MNTRVLVLTSSTGSGHDMRAKAFARWAAELWGDAVTVHIEQILENGSLLGRFGVWLYNTIHRHAPFLHNLYFFIVELFILSHARSVSFGGRYYRDLLARFRPHLVFSVHDSTNRGYFEDAKRLLGDQVRCVTYCGEFSGGYGYSRNWVNPRADLFVARTAQARDHAIRLGMPADRTAVFQRLLPPEALQPPVDAAGRAAIRCQLGLDPDRFTLFLATGGFGANHHAEFLDAVLPLAAQIQVIAVCGRNQALHEQLTRWSRRHPQLQAYIEGYSDRMADFLQVSDALITRGGANTTMEALHYGCPLLYNALGGLMPQERCTVRYFLAHDAARLLRRARDATRVLGDWSGFGPDYQRVRARLATLRHAEDPAALARAVMGPLAPA